MVYKPRMARWSSWDGWTGNRVVESSVERFALEDVFPLVKQDVDGIGVNLPQNPLALLHQQYGEKCFGYGDRTTTIILLTDSHSKFYDYCGFACKKHKKHERDVCEKFA